MSKELNQLLKHLEITLHDLHETIREHNKEYLVDLDHLLNYFGDKGYQVLENTSFNKLLNTYKGPPLSNGEKKFTGMYNAVVLKKD